MFENELFVDELYNSSFKNESALQIFVFSLKKI